MPRTTSDLVEGIIEVDDTIPLDPFIEIATDIVTEVCASKTKADGSPYYTDARLELIERWLSAHFYAIRDPRTTLEEAGPVEARYQSKVDLGFNVTHYGQMAMRIDTAGGLAGINAAVNSGGRITAAVKWLGTEEEETEL